MAGIPFRVALVIPLVLIAGNQPQGEKSAAQVIRKAVSAHGGKENLERLRRVRVTYTFKGVLPKELVRMKDDLELDLAVEELIDIPRRMRKAVSGKMNGMEVRVAWAAETGKERYWFAENGKLKWFTSKKPFDAGTSQRTYQLLEQLPHLDAKEVKFAGEKGGVKNEVGVILPGASGATYFDKKTGLLAGTENFNYVPPGASKGLDLRAEYGGYRVVEGARLFTSMVSYRGKQKLFEIRVTDVRFVKEFQDRDFAPPGE